MRTNVKTMLKLFLVVLVFGSLMTACKKDEQKDEGKVAVKMTDDPFPFQFVTEANVKITKIELKNEDTDEYVTVFSGNSEVNIANYTNGDTAEITLATLPAGTYKKAKVTIGGVTVTLSNNQTFDYTGNGSFEAETPIFPEIVVHNGDQTNLLFDMDLSDSIEFSGNFMDWITDPLQITGISSFDPDLRAVNLSHTGSIEGQVNDNSGNAVAYAEIKVKYDYDNDGMDDDVTTIADANGHFKIIGLPQGTYKVEVDTDNHGDAEVDNVSVTVQHNTTVNVTLQ